MTESNNREAELFAGALAVPEGERPRFLDAACGGDARLRERIEQLLKAHQSAGRFMDSPAVPGPPDGPPPAASPKAGAEAPGARIGRYRLQQRIGEGGCGVVWMAEQEEPVRRKVALKIVKLGMDTREVIARFDAERQALAMLDHPNIAKILDAGATDAGRPYFVMELVRGVKITEFFDRNNLSTTQRLELFSSVCHAVQHAHQKGIIHRDLKPSNILVTLNDGVPVPKVIDFGIAKATAGRLTDHTLFTAFEQFIGTPAYMSPEQAELSGIDIDTRSDIYSLGVLLYELLTGRLPFDPKSLLQAGIDEIRRIIREVEPPKPSTNLSTLGDADRAHVARVRSTDAERLSILLRGDLDWIVMRCLEKDRARRYETPNALAADITRHLRNEPVVARPPSRGYRLERLVRRNRMAFAAAGAVALALLAGFMISTWQAVRATRAERLADVERGRAENLLKFMLGDLYTKLDGVGRLDVLDAVADKATAYFASLGPDDLNDTTRLSRAKALRLLGGVRMSQGRYADAVEAFTGAYSRAAEMASRHPRDGEVLFERGQAEFGIGYVHLRRAEYPPAGEWFTRYRDTCVALVALDPARTDWQLELVDGQGNLAALDKERGEYAAARAGYLSELATLEKLAAGDPGNLQIRSKMADAHAWLGSIAELQGAYAEALRQFSTQSAQLESLAQSDPKTAIWSQYQSVALVNVVAIDMVTGRYEAAGESLVRAQKLLDALVAHDPENAYWKGFSLHARLAEASLARRRGDGAGARRAVDGALSQLESLSASEPTERSFALLLMQAWEMEAQLQSDARQPAAAASAAHAVEMAERLSRSQGATDAEAGEFAQTHVISGEVAAASGDEGAARRDGLRATELLAPRIHSSVDWRLLDPAARAAALLGRFGEARAMVARLNQLGYVPIDPWPELDPPGAAKSSDPQPK